MGERLTEQLNGEQRGKQKSFGPPGIGQGAGSSGSGIFAFGGRQRDLSAAHERLEEIPPRERSFERRRVLENAGMGKLVRVAVESITDTEAGT